MPVVDVERHVDADPNQVWAVITNVESYPQYMDSVRSIAVLTSEGVNRTVEWRVTLRGSVLTWVEEEVLDPDRRIVRFQQIDGDLDRFDGDWTVTAADGGSLVTLHVDLEIGIPLLANMLNPIAASTVQSNADQMLAAIANRTLANSRSTAWHQA
jgi:ribosome-associated toxin RatA of RatAB toxin-antitoxin module